MDPTTGIIAQALESGMALDAFSMQTFGAHLPGNFLGGPGLASTSPQDASVSPLPVSPPRRITGGGLGHFLQYLQNSLSVADSLLSQTCLHGSGYPTAPQRHRERARSEDIWHKMCRAHLTKTKTKTVHQGPPAASWERESETMKTETKTVHQGPPAASWERESETARPQRALLV
jgi:hypothetical protein